MKLLTIIVEGKCICVLLSEFSFSTEISQLFEQMIYVAKHFIYRPLSLVRWETTGGNGRKIRSETVNTESGEGSREIRKDLISINLTYEKKIFF